MPQTITTGYRALVDAANSEIEASDGIGHSG